MFCTNRSADIIVILNDTVKDAEVNFIYEEYRNLYVLMVVNRSLKHTFFKTVVKCKIIG